MRRREFIAALVAAALPPAARAQQKQAPIVGFLAGGDRRETQLDAFRSGLIDRGYIEGKNVRLEQRWAGDDYNKFGPLAVELVNRPVTVLACANLAAALAAKQATTSIPIVFLIGDDPIKHGLAARLNHPGDNSTGVSMLAAGLVAKRLQLLREIVPGNGLIAVLVNPDNPNVLTQRAETQEAARLVGERIEVFNARTVDELGAAFTGLTKHRARVVVVGPDPFFNNRQAEIIGLAARYSIPAIYEWREFVELGGLASYGTNQAGVFRQVGVYCARILNGEKPADMPVEQPTKFELVINMKTAKSLGLTVPQSILARADEVIE